MSVSYTQLRGGIDVTSPPNAIDPGRSLVAINYTTPDTGGYRSLAGYTLLGAGAPTGTGNILGLAVWNEDIYCIRESGGNGVLYKLVAGVWTGVGSGLPIGRYEFVVGNFFALAASENLFMVCAAGKPWKYDGTTLSEISTAPTGAKFIDIHANHLFIGIEAGSVQWSATGDPDDWTALNGAGELGVSDKVTGLGSISQALVIGGQTSIKVLYGSSVADFTVSDFARNAGIAEYTMAVVGTLPIFKTTKGLSSLNAVQAYGNFAMGEWANQVAPIFRAKGAPSCSMASRNSNQYRLYYPDGTGIIATFAGQNLVGITTIIIPDNITLCATGDAISGTDINVFADDAGQVFQLDTGTTFNGLAINTYLSMAYNHFGAPTMRKRFRRIFLDVVSESAIQLNVLPTYDFGAEKVPRHRVLFKDTLAAGGIWDFATWDAFAWGSPILDMSQLRLVGTGANLGLVINSSSTTDLPHTILGYTTHYDPRRLNRA